MADDASDFLIRARLDASDVATGATDAVEQVDRVAGSLGRVEEASGGAEKGFKRMVEEAGTMREADRIYMGLFDTLEGGGRTVMGLTEIMRFFLLTAVDLNPEILAATLLFGGLAGALGRHATEAGKASEANKDAAGSTKELADAVATGLKNVGEAQKDAVTSIGERQVEAFTALKDIQSEEVRHTAELVKQLDLVQKIAQQQLEIGRAKALSQNTAGPEGVRSIDKYYDTLEEASKAVDVGQRLQIIARGDVQQRSTVGTNIAKESENRAQLTKLLDAFQESLKARANASAVGVHPDESGDFKSAIDDLQKRLQGARQQGADDHERSTGPAWYGLSNKERNDAFSPIFKEDDIAIRSLETALEMARQAQLSKEKATGSGPELKKQLDANNQRLSDLESKFTDLTSHIQEDRLNQQVAANQAELDKAAKDKSNHEADAALADKEFSDKNSADVGAQQLISTNETLPLGQREAAMREIARLKNEALQRQIDEGTGTGTFAGKGAPDKPISDEEVRHLYQQQNTNSIEAGRSVQNQQDKAEGVSGDGKGSFDQATAALQQLVEQGRAILDSSNNAALRAAFNQQLDLRGQAGFLGEQFSGSASPQESILARQIQQALADQGSARGAGGKPGAAAPKSTGEIDTDNLSQEVQQATSEASSRGMTRLLTMVGQAVDLHTKTVDLIEVFSASNDGKLQAIAQKLSALESKVKNGNSN